MQQQEYYKDLDRYEDLAAHRAVILNTIQQDDRALVGRAIRIAEKYHDTPRTLYTGNYNRHPMRVARILLEEFGVTDTKAVLIALCHDLGEWSDYDVNDLENEFGTEVKAGVDALTWDEHDTWEEFFQKIMSTGDDNLIQVKLADKLDNNRAAAFAHDEQERQKAKDKTELVLRPFVEKQFPEHWRKFEESLERLA